MHDMDRNACLLGFMGTGKTSVGKVLANTLDMEFIETDDLIVKKAGKSIPAIFKDDGEIRFRELEIAVCKELQDVRRSVISLGGGVMLNYINFLYLRQHSDFFHLIASPSTILARIMQDGKDKRPLLACPDPLAEINRLLYLRKPFYKIAGAREILTDDRLIPSIAGEIATIMKGHEGCE
ncbi:shikimate kinase [Candidatus Bathyarchaeota archaeon]|nr:shikimate kinase [Candidatus Bathyarchaeota archaeon]